MHSRGGLPLLRRGAEERQVVTASNTGNTRASRHLPPYSETATSLVTASIESGPWQRSIYRARKGSDSEIGDSDLKLEGGGYGRRKERKIIRCLRRVTKKKQSLNPSTGFISNIRLRGTCTRSLCSLQRDLNEVSPPQISPYISSPFNVGDLLRVSLSE